MAWSVAKKKWCCQAYRRGCPGDAVQAEEALTASSDEQLASGGSRSFRYVEAFELAPRRAASANQVPLAPLLAAAAASIAAAAVVGGRALLARGRPAAAGGPEESTLELLPGRPAGGDGRRTPQLS